MIELMGIPVSLDSMLPGHDAELHQEIHAATGIRIEAIRKGILTRKGVDARKRSNVHFVISYAVDDRAVSDAGSQLPKGIRYRDHVAPKPISAPDLTEYAPEDHDRPVIVGSGPAGLFCALYLARAGLRPIIIERGQDVVERKRRVDGFFSGGQLDPECNVQFGEGGAGTFSDGKLTTGTKGPHIKGILYELVQAGAPERILVDAKPHVGTDILVGVMQGIRQSIEESGGEYRFGTRLDDIQVEEGRLRSITVSHSEDADRERIGERMVCDSLVLAIGHSARDTYEMLRSRGVFMERKPFAMGARIEHLQEDIDRAQYGRFAGHPALGPADYKLSLKDPSGRGVYTFCMCPGGTVVAAASEVGGICVNGMSDSSRDAVNANSALLVEVSPEDLEGDDVLAGMHLQRRVERAAYGLANDDDAQRPYMAPAQTVRDLLSSSDDVTPSSKVVPSYPRGVAWRGIEGCLPDYVIDGMRYAIPAFDRRLRGFADPEAVLTAVEARSSAPVRMVRDRSTLQAIGIEGLYPCGEGAGYAGGIMSAASDGLRCAEKVVERIASMG